MITIYITYIHICTYARWASRITRRGDRCKHGFEGIRNTGVVDACGLDSLARSPSKQDRVANHL